MPRTEIEGIEVRYERAGEGPALALLHGFTHDSRVWRPQLQALSARFDVIAWDAPGAGRSGDPPEAFTIQDWARCLAALLDFNAVHKAHVLGLSWGGLLAQEFYRHYPGRVLSLLLAGTYAGWKGSLPPPLPQERLAACLQDASLPPSDFVTKYLPAMFGDSPPQQALDQLRAIMSDFHPLGFSLMAKSLAISDTRGLLPTIQVPTLLIWGDTDRRSPLAVAHQFFDAIPTAILSIIPGAGHISNLERPTESNLAVADFCHQ